MDANKNDFLYKRSKVNVLGRVKGQILAKKSQKIAIFSLKQSCKVNTVLEMCFIDWFYSFGEKLSYNYTF